ncbi:FecR family protein [Spirosoma litoris]
MKAAAKKGLPLTDKMDPQQLRALLTKYQNGEASDSERTQVEAWYDALDAEAELTRSASDKRAFIEHYWQQLAEQIRPSTNVRAMPIGLYRLAAAAVLVLGIGLSWYFLMNPGRETDSGRLTAQTGKLELVRKTNESDQPIRVALSDGSVITLKPGSQVQYPSMFTGNRREVQLNGEAFFEVTKNPEQPFLVYANGLVTKVLGTSFTIVAKADKPTAEVVVRTGRVAVYQQTDNQAAASDMVLKPNEKATYFLADKRIVKSLADHPVVLRPEAIKTHFVFDDTPVARVFRELDDVYGIHISFDEQALVNCTLTANLANQPLSAQLDMICLSIGATYQTKGTQIQVSSRGCP